MASLKPVVLDETCRELGTAQNAYLAQIATALAAMASGQSLQSVLAESAAPVAGAAEVDKTAALVEYLCVLEGVPIESSITPKDAYTAGCWTASMVKLLVERQRLTEEEYKDITGESYTA